MDKLQSSTSFRQPNNFVYQNRMKLDVLNKYLSIAISAQTDKFKTKLVSLTGRLDTLSPLKTLCRGYGIIKSCETGRVVKSFNDVAKGETLEICVNDGLIYSVVSEVEGGKIFE